MKKIGIVAHSEMVTAVSGTDTRFILTGCSDQIGRLWTNERDCTHILEGHTQGISSVNFFRPKDVEEDSNVYVATASKDNTLMFWKCDADEPNLEKKVNSIKVLNSHTASVNSVVANPSEDKLCSGSCDFKIKIWQTRHSSETGELEVDVAGPVFRHRKAITSAVWPEENYIYSASMDRSICKWDIEHYIRVWNVEIEKSFMNIDIGGDNLIASGAIDNILRIWDTRKPDLPINSISYHTSWISACKWHKESSYHLLSASYDEKVMLWDMRTTKSPIGVMSSHKSPVLAVDWWKDNLIVSGGSDSSVLISDVSSALQ